MRGPKRGPCACPAELGLDREQQVEQRSGSELGVEGRGGVQEARLVEEPDRVGLAEGRDGGDVDLRVEGEHVDRAPDRRSRSPRFEPSPT